MTLKNHYLGVIAQLCRAISSQLRHLSTIGKKLVKQQYVLHMSPQYGELRPTSDWDRSGSLRHPCKFQRVSRLGGVTAGHLIVAVLNGGRHLCSGGRPSRWALAHISSFVFILCSSTFVLIGECVLLLWPPYVIGQAIIFLPCGFFLLSFFSSPNLSGRR